MCKLALNIDNAADATDCTTQLIALAIRDRDLIAHRIDGQAIILPADLATWIQAQPVF